MISKCTTTAKVIECLFVESTIGSGTEENPFRRVTQYFDLDGKLLWENDNWLKEREAARQAGGENG